MTREEHGLGTWKVTNLWGEGCPPRWGTSPLTPAPLSHREKSPQNRNVSFPHLPVLATINDVFGVLMRKGTHVIAV